MKKLGHWLTVILITILFIGNIGTLGVQAADNNTPTNDEYLQKVKIRVPWLWVPVRIFPLMNLLLMENLKLLEWMLQLHKRLLKIWALNW